MPYEPKDDTGALFPNRKQHERQPDWRGNAMINGTMVDIAAWVKTSSKGTEFLSLKFSEPRERDQAAKPASPAPEADFPF